MAEQLLLVRHASVGVAWRGRYIGATDAPLDETGTEQAKALADDLKTRAVNCIFCSPLRRARETAREVAEATGVAITEAADLREVDFGRWEGKTFEEIRAEDPELVTQWANWDPQFRFPEGERICDFLARVAAAADRLAKADAASVVVVTHGGVIRSMLCHLLGLDTRKYVAFEVYSAAITTVRLYDGKGVLTELNERCHLT